MSATRRSLGLAVLVGYPLFGLAIEAYILATGLSSRTPAWGRVTAYVFPLVAVVLFAWYLRRHRRHEHRELLFAYGGAASVLGGAVYTAPGVITIQQAMIGDPILNADVYLMDLWLGGGLFGLAVGHFYARSRAERAALERREGELEQHRERLTVLNRVLRHDIRNQINVILAAVSDLPEEDAPPPLERIEARSRKILEISENARRIESIARRNRAPTETEDAVAIVERTAERTRSRFPDAEIRTDVPGEARVTSNGHFESAVRNVLENAVEHNDADDPDVEVTVAKGGDEVRVRVADNGPGIPEQERVVFERRTETELSHSSGLGLWLVHWIVEDSDGTVRVEDREPRGTVVTLCLPRA
ncbi:MAG: sensor histidine kinase [Halobacteriales archaeon]